MPHACPGTVDLIAKEDGIVAGLAVYARVFTLLDPGAKVEFFCRDGDTVQPGQKLAVVTGDIRALLSGERVALNYLQRMSGIATYTHQLSALLEGTGITLLDTRKTSPNNRIFEKYAVRVGGGSNHRTGLSDGVLLKDNHIGAAGGVAKAVKMARQYASFVRKIEVEVETLEQVKEAVEAGADIIMLDNMSDEDMRKAVTLIAGRAKTECSGNVTRENIARLRDIGIDYVSSGALTHSAPILDLSMKHLRPLTAEEADMTTAERRAAILQQLAHAGAPLAARTLATHYGVSRQVIVQDLAVIRASHPGIISTARGYVLEQPDQPPAAHGSSRCATHLTEPGRS